MTSSLSLLRTNTDYFIANQNTLYIASTMVNCSFFVMFALKSKLLHNDRMHYFIIIKCEITHLIKLIWVRWVFLETAFKPLFFWLTPVCRSTVNRVWIAMKVSWPFLQLIKSWNRFAMYWPACRDSLIV